MGEEGFPKAVEDIVATLADIYRHQSESDIVELLESASARIEQTGYDNWHDTLGIHVWPESLVHRNSGNPNGVALVLTANVVFEVFYAARFF